MIFNLNDLFMYFDVDIPGRAAEKIPKNTLIPLGVLFVVLALICFVIYAKYSIAKIRNYKQLQMDEYNRDNPRNKKTTYEATEMYLPAWQRAKYNIPLFLGVVFIASAFIMFMLLLKS
ncbi:hypothetical protein ACXYRP_00135 [Mycoplasma sp. 5912]